MSLLDALLLEGYRDPREIWIALRTDSKGSGTIDDPYSGSSIPHPALTISSLMKVTAGGADGKTASVTTSTEHGFTTGDLVTIGGVDIQLANLNDDYYVGTFAIIVTGLNTFTYTLLYTLLNAPPSPTAPVPSGGSIQCWREREQFDRVMRGVPANAVIHLGPGVFETKGHTDVGPNEVAPGGWLAKSGQRFLGAGMGLTTLKLVNASAVSWIHFAIFASSVDGFEVSDLTVDCNADGQLSPQTNCAAIAINPGAVRHVRLRRVRVINFGSNGPVGNGGYSENFPIFVSGTDVVDVVYEDCVAEQPAPNAVWNSTILALSGGYDRKIGKMYYGRALVLRNNYVNGQIVYGPRAYIDSLEVDGSNVVTLITKTPHGRSVPGNVSVQGVKVNGNTNNRFNGVFKIDQIIPDTVLKYTVFIPNEELQEVSGNPTVDADTIIGAPVSPHLVGIAVISVAADNKTFTVTTLEPFAPHNLTVNNRSWINGVAINGFVPGSMNPQIPKSLASNNADNPCNGHFRVTEVISKTKLKYEADQPINPQVIAPNYTFTGHTAMGLGHLLASAGNGTGVVMEGNRLLHGASGGPGQDTASSLDLVVRNNYYHDIDGGPKFNMGHEIEPFKSPVSLTHDGFVAMCSVGSQDHGLVVGQIVRIENAHVNGDLDPYGGFNGYHIVKTAAPGLFTYEMSIQPSGNADSSPPEKTPLFRPVSQIANFIFENNIIELALSVLQGYWSQPSGVLMGIDPNASSHIPYAFRQVLVRENVIRQMDGQTDIWHYGVIVRRSEKLQVDNNVIDVGGGGVRFDKSVSPNFFNNRNSAGQLELGYNEATTQSQDELTTRIEDALLLSL